MKKNSDQYNTKYTFALVVVSLITILIFLFIEDLKIQTLAFLTLSLLLTLNSYQAYLASNKTKYKFKLGFSVLAFLIFLIYSIILFIN